MREQAGRCRRRRWWPNAARSAGPGRRGDAVFGAVATALLVPGLVVGGCQPGHQRTAPVPGRAAKPAAAALPGMPATLDPGDVYAADRPGRLAPAVRGVPPRVWVPNSEDGTVHVIDPRTRRVVRRFRVGRMPQHVTPSWDLRTLWVNNNESNSLTPIDAATGKVGRPVPVDDPYNLYFTPDGRRAIVVAEDLQRLDFRDPHSMRLRHSLRVPCAGVDHLDFSADGRYLLASCEFGASMIKVDVARERLLGVLRLRAGAMPQDVKLAPDGRVFYVADMAAGGVWLIDGARPAVSGFLPTGAGAHGLYVSRDSRMLYVSNRQAGSVSVVSFASRRVVSTWRLPGGGSPDMGGVSADG